MSLLPDIKNNFAEWYIEVINKAELVDQSPVRGTMVVRPYGWSIWEHIKDRLDKRIKATGHQNAAFPLFIPESFLKKEAAHIQGFAPELAVVTHAGGKELEEPLVVRPTSETIIHHMFARWMSSWRDLPIKINQWANVVRWEMRPRPFLRTTEFFWQEGHTAHATREEAYEEVMTMLHEYVSLARDYLAIPVIAGQKTESERFPGAEITMTFESLMQDGKSLQMGTSHLLSQSFAKAFNMVFQDKNNMQAYPWLTSWGVTTRLIGALVMVHGDQKGLVLPPMVAPIQLIIIPIGKKDGEYEQALAQAMRIKATLDPLVRCEIDTRDYKTPGTKFYEWELKGVPLRLEIGIRDIAHHRAVLKTRLHDRKIELAQDDLVMQVPRILQEIQSDLFIGASNRFEQMKLRGEKLVKFGPQLEEYNGMYQTGWCDNALCEQQLKHYKAFTRCLTGTTTFDFCFHCTHKNRGDVFVAKAY